MKIISRIFIIIAAAIVFLNNLYAQPLPLSADSLLKEASAKAFRENKKVFIIFHASWCGWCRTMDSAMNDITVKDFFNKNFVITHLDVYEHENKKHLENPGALELLTKYKGNDQGIPYWLVFDAQGNLLADSQIKPGVNTGCPATKEEVDHFIHVLEKTTSLSETELTIIEKKFLRNGG